MKRNKGFTLIELMVVVAIIAILAAIVVPRIAVYIAKTNMTRAAVEINNIETSLTKMLGDAAVRDFRAFFVAQGVYTGIPTQLAINECTKRVYELLRRGKEAGRDPANPTTNLLGFRNEILDRLGTSYMELGKDPFGSVYQFWMGPWSTSGSGPIHFRSFRVKPGGGEQPDGTYDPYVYDDSAKNIADTNIPGNPPRDNQFGFPAPVDLPFYVWSRGEDLDSNQLFNNTNTPNDHKGGGDDINNWDNQSGWSSFYA